MMNIIPPIPANITFNTSTVNNEATRRDNVRKETIPATTQSENSAADKGLGSESDRAKAPGQSPAPLTYEKPQISQNEALDSQANQSKDNGSDESAGREDAESRQKEQQQTEESQTQELKARDIEVRTHEQAHAAIGGQHASSPKYEYETGPDGRQYAVDGEVSINISAEPSPEETIRKMQQVKSAALAPADPSPQDLQVAAEATQKSVEARTEIAKENAQEAEQAVQFGQVKNSFAEGINETKDADSIFPPPPSVDETANGIDISSPTRSLEKTEAPLGAKQTEDAVMEEQIKLFYANRDQQIVRRLAVIDNFYQQVSVPNESGFKQTA